MLNEENIKIGSRIIYTGYVGTISNSNKLIFGRFTVITHVKYLGLDTFTTKIFLYTDEKELVNFDIGSTLANCFETVKELRKRKLEKLSMI